MGKTSHRPIPVPLTLCFVQAALPNKDMGSLAFVLTRSSIQRSCSNTIHHFHRRYHRSYRVNRLPLPTHSKATTTSTNVNSFSDFQLEYDSDTDAMSLSPRTTSFSQPSQTQIYNLSHILQYLSQVETILRSSSPSPAIKYNHCINNGDNSTFFKYVGAVLAKPMLRTLIYGDTTNNMFPQLERVQFDQRLREERHSIEFQRMYCFVVHALRPAALALDDDVRNECIPDLIDQIDAIESAYSETNSGKSDNKGWTNVFCRLASGRRYQGKLQRLVQELFPQLTEELQLASMKAAERDVIERVIRLDLIDAISTRKLCDDNVTEDRTDWTARRISATWKALDRFYPASEPATSSSNGEAYNDNTECPSLSGKRAEESCISYLQKMHSDHTILQNVYVNTRRTSFSSKSSSAIAKGQSMPKYKPPKSHKSGLAIIWTDGGDGCRHRLCSELDAIVLSTTFNNDEIDSDTKQHIHSVWEAKRTISPSTLYDILTKKLGAVEALLDDESAELIYEEDAGMRSVQFAPTEGHPSSQRLTFGVFGTELLAPPNAADSIRSIAGSNVVSSDLREVVRAIERGCDNNAFAVEVDITQALKIVESLKRVVEEKQSENRVQIVMSVDEAVDFL